ncbi:MAG: septum formation initiator family protein [Deltaproteobacteria bacterium]|nr:MAG: septum formation initiator family protein [Deltaproteobacteria bacterium]
MKKRGILLLVLVLFLVLGLLTFFGDKGILHLFRLQKELSRIKDDNRKIEEENRRLREEVRRLQNEKRYIEEVARKELGMAKEGEMIYQFDLPKKAKEPSK